MQVGWTWHTEGIVIASPSRLPDIADVRVTSDGGAVVIPFVLPFRVPAEAMGMTVREWLGLADAQHLPPR
ncbi:hypothetical protein AB0O28_18870 [Microbispora sp. NPDC088329]|uniref:hypothetical protein n=1 Tax=Microbispora sp. NPDC088329 TaxID=3154869 RepID=UPI00342510C8